MHSNDKIIEKARAARDRGRADLAVPEIQRALKRDGDDYRLWHMLGLLYRALQKSDRAIEALRKADALAPETASILHAQARVTMEAGLPAVALYDRVLSLLPGDGDIIIGRSAAQIAEGSVQQALVDLEQITRNNPDWVDGQRQLAALRWMGGDRDHYLSGYRQALATNPRNGALWSSMFDALVQASDFETLDAAVSDARRHFGAAKGLDVQEAIAASEIGDAERADRLFASLEPYQETAIAVRHVRHFLRTDRASEAGELGMRFTGKPDANQIWPYIALAWRLTGDERWRWLEGDERLIGIYDLSDRVDLAALAECLRSIHVLKADMIGESVRGGTQTDGPLFARIEPEIQALRKAIESTVRKHAKPFGRASDSDHPVLRQRPQLIRFSGSWSVRLAGDGHHAHHIHPEGWLSSAFYVTLPDPEEAGSSPNGWLAFGAPPDELGLDLAPWRTVEPKPGQLVLFPSICWHGTYPIDRGERMTVAFDVAPPS